MLELYEESAIEGMESGLFAYLAHPDLFMRSYPEFDSHCKLISRHICRTAARLNIPLEYNIGMMDHNQAFGTLTYPHPEFWHIAVHDTKSLEYSGYYDQACENLKLLKIKTIDTLPRLNE